MTGRLAVLVTLIGILIGSSLLGCASDNELETPFDCIIPSCQDCKTTPDLWFENTGMGKFHTENRIIEHYERACDGEGVKLWMLIEVFANEADAHTYIADSPYKDVFTWEAHELPPMVKHKPDEYLIFGIDSKPNFREGDYEYYGDLCEGITFRVGRYVGDYSVTRYFDAVSMYLAWKEEVGGVGSACRDDLYSLVDRTVPLLRSETP